MCLLVLTAATSLTACYAETKPATDVTATSAKLRASGHTDSTPAEVYFEYSTERQSLGTPTAFTTPRRRVPANVPGPGRPDVPFSETVKALLPSTTYHFRVCGDDGSTDRDVCHRTLSFTTSQGAREVDFTPRTFTLPASQTSGRLAFGTADANRDGRVDLLVATGDGVSLRLGDGEGGFGPARQVSSTTSSFAAGGDVNGDGRPDLITGEQMPERPSPPTVAVRLGDGAGRFGPVVSRTEVNGESTDPILRDFDRDGDLDLAVAVNSGFHFALPFPAVLGNDGAGHLVAEEDLSLLYGGGRLAAADLDRDGIPDLVALQQHPSDVPPTAEPATLSAALGHGDLTFGDDLIGPEADASLVLGDYDRDGRIDAVVGQLGQTERRLGAVLRGDGDGTFGGALTFSAGRISRHLLRADFNRDGIPDVAADGISVLLGDGNGSLRTPNAFAQGEARLVADFNRDGRPDILGSDLVCCSPGPPWRWEVHVLLNTMP